MENFGRYNGSPSGASPENFKLKWHKFLIWFALWMGALGNAVNAIGLIGGTAYVDQSEEIYAAFERLRVIDLVWGIVLLGLSAYMIYVRFQLAGFRIDAPKKLSILYVANLVCSLGYLLAVSSVTHLSLRTIMSEITVTLIGSILMLFINQNYYNKRLELFVN
ncbi:MAG: hypothetical protein II879_05155 [Clostridia bacterium]|nr:hypothetical protein [Clostridia bacterium]